MLRRDIRSTLRIRGTSWKDALVSVLCMPNVIAQSTIELEQEMMRLRILRLMAQRYGDDVDTARAEAYHQLNILSTSPTVM